MDTDTDIRMSLEASLRLLVEEQHSGIEATPEQVGAEVERILARLASPEVCQTIMRGGEAMTRGEGVFVQDGESLADAFLKQRPEERKAPK